MPNKIIEVTDLTFKYRDMSKPAINNISFDVNKGEWLSIIGKNGSGKSTLINLLDGLLKPQSGQIKIDDQDINESEDTINDTRRKVGLVFQHSSNQFVASTVEDDVAFGLENQLVDTSNMKTIVHDVLKEVDMLDYRKSDPSMLSGGQQQRVAIAGILALRPEIIILDEATSMLDPKAKAMITQLIDRIRNKYHLTVISITHNIKEIENSHRCILLKDGQIVENTVPDALFSNLQDVKSYGLTLPFSEQLRIKLKNNGIDVPEKYMNDEEIVEWITKYYSKM